MGPNGKKPVQIKRIEKRLDSLFAGKIDMSDWSNHSEDERRHPFLQRALAAYALISLEGVDPATAASAITDGGQDAGIDAVLVQSAASVVYFVQSKWCEGGKRSIEIGDVLKFAEGIGRLLCEDLDGLNAKIQAKADQLRAAIYDAATTFVAVLVSPVEQLLGKEASETIRRKLDEINGQTDPIIRLERLDLSWLYHSLLQSAGQSSIDLDITLHEWGVTKDPYEAFYGQVDVGQVASWSQFGKALFAKNLRSFLGTRTEVFASVADTLTQEPTHFWYYNNGATLLCDSIKKKPIYGEKRDQGIFECKGVSVVNGAQTIGSIWSASRTADNLDPRSRIQLRMISLQSCPEGFASAVTRAANTQNRIERRDFAALDPNQQRLAIEMALEGRRYTYRSGDEMPPDQEGCDITEATISLACASDLALAVQAKREVSRLWSNIEKAPYRLLFNDSLTPDYLWKAVRIQRAVESALKGGKFDGVYRGKLVAAHGNRFILYRVFQDPEVAAFRAATADMDAIDKKARATAIRELWSVATFLHKSYPNTYPQTFFKNYERCREASRWISQHAPDDSANDPFRLF